MINPVLFAGSTVQSVDASDGTFAIVPNNDWYFYESGAHSAGKKEKSIAKSRCEETENARLQM